MEVFLLFGLLILGLPSVGVIVLLIWSARAGREIAELRKRIEVLEHRPARSPEPQPQPRPAPAVQPARPKRVAPSLTRSPDLERQMGTRVSVWLGAVAFALAGAFLVKHAVDQGWLGAHARVILGLVFGCSLIGVGEWVRARTAHIAQGLTAAGIAVLFAALFAGINLYEIIPVIPGFALLALTTGGGVVLSLRHGPFVALLGLVGGFLTPYWVSTGTPHPWVLLAYLLLLQAGLFSVSRRMTWWPIAGLTVLGTVVWGTMWVADFASYGRDAPAVGLFLLLSPLMLVLAAGRSESWKSSGVAWGLAVSSTGACLVLLAALVAAGDFGYRDWGFFGLLGAGCILLGRKDARYETLAWVAACLSAMLLFGWSAQTANGSDSRVWLVYIALTVVYAGGAYLALWKSKRPQFWAALCGVASLALFLAVATGLGPSSDLPAWGLQSLALAGLLTMAAVPLLKRRDAMPANNEALAALAATITALVSLAVPLELERAWIGVAWAIEVPALIFIAQRLRVPLLTRLATALATGVAVRLLLNPAILEYPIGGGMPFNWLLYGYGIPIVAFAAAARLLRRRDNRSANGLLGAATLFGLALTTLQIRQLFHPGELAAPVTELTEWACYTIAWSLYAVGLLLAHERTGRALFRPVASAVGIAAMAQGVAVLGLAANPLLTPHAVGHALIFNSLPFVYGLTCAIAAVLARRFTAIGRVIESRISGSVALLLGFLLVTLEVRQAFHGDFLNQGSLTNAEMYTYSLVWLLGGLGLLVAGIVTRGIVLRYGSAVVMALTVGKVFLIDMGHLEDLYRVVSFFGLGISLMLLAFLYQKFVFGPIEEC